MTQTINQRRQHRMILTFLFDIQNEVIILGIPLMKMFRRSRFSWLLGSSRDLEAELHLPHSVLIQGNTRKPDDFSFHFSAAEQSLFFAPSSLDDPTHKTPIFHPSTHSLYTSSDFGARNFLSPCRGTARLHTENTGPTIHGSYPSETARIRTRNCRFSRDYLHCTSLSRYTAKKT